MNRRTIVWPILLIFGGITLAEAIIRFGWQDVDLPPFQFALYSCGVALRNTITHTCIFLALPFLFGKWSRIPIILSAIYVILIDCSVFYTDHVFHANLASIWLELVQNTSTSEITNFLSMALTPLSLLGLAIILVFSGFAVYWLFKAQYPICSRMNLVRGTCLLLPFVICNLLIMNWHWGLAQTHYTTFPITTYMTWKNEQGVRTACSQPKLPPEIDTKVAQSELPNVVFVLGESSTRNNWHLYGYPRSTTPHLDELSKQGSAIVYSDVVGSQPATVSALSILLTDVELECPSEGHWTLAEVYRRAGYQCVLISQQTREEDTSSTLARIFNGCEKRVHVRTQYGKTVFDEAIIPLVKRELEQNTSVPKVIFVHLAGMHYPVHNANPPEDNYFSDTVESEVLHGLDERARDRINRYDNAIRYEDKVLGGLIATLNSHSRPTCLFFSSDHGESPRAQDWRNYSDLDVYELPVFFWFSDGYRSRFTDTVEAIRKARALPLQTDQMTTGLLVLGQISLWSDKMMVHNFLDSQFKGRTRRMIDKGRRAYSTSVK